MAAHQLSEQEFSYADSVGSSPRSAATTDYQNFPPGRWPPESEHPRVRFMCSFGGRIVPRPHDNQLRYVGGETRIVAVARNASYAGIMAKLSKITGNEVSVKYQLPNEDLDALISVTTDEDVENMMEEYDRLAVSGNYKSTARLRLFLFPANLPSESSNLTTFLDGSKRENWFLDALNVGQGQVPAMELERRRSESSSIISEVPDYLFGFDQPDNLDRDDVIQKSGSLKPKPKIFHGDQAPVSDPGSPAQYYSTSTASIMLPPFPDLPPLKIKSEETVVSDSGSVPTRNPPLEKTISQVSQVEAFSNPPQYVQPWQLVQESHFQAGNPGVTSVPMYYIPAGALPVQYGQPVMPRSSVAPVNLPLPVGFQQRIPTGQIYQTHIQEGKIAGIPPPPPEGYSYPPGVMPEGAIPQMQTQAYYYAPRVSGQVTSYPMGVPPGTDVNTVESSGGYVSHPHK